MDNEQMNNDFEEHYKEQLENLPEEKPSDGDWEQLRGNLQKEGLLKPASNGRKYLLLVLLLLFAGGIISVPLLMNRYGLDVSMISSSGNSAEQNKITINHSKEKAVTSNSTAKEITQEEKKYSEQMNPEKEASSIRAAENNSGSEDKMISLSGTKKVSGKTGAGGKEDKLKQSVSGKANKNSKGDKPVSGNNNSDAGVSSNSNTDTEGGMKNSVTVDSGNVVVAANENGNSQEIKTTDTASVVAAVPAEEKKPDSSQIFIPAAKDSIVKKSGSGRKPWIGIFMSCDFTSYHLQESSNATASESNAVLNSNGIAGENSSAQYTLGLMGGLHVTERISLEGGIFYSQKRKLSALVSTIAYTDEEGVETFSDFTYSYSAKYFEAYGRIKYYLSQKKHSYYAGIGATGSFNFPSAKTDRGYFERTTFSVTAAPQTDRITQGASSVSLSVIVSAGMEINLSPRWNLFFEPSYHYAFSPVVGYSGYEKIPVEHFWRTLSLGTGLMYKF